MLRSDSLCGLHANLFHFLCLSLLFSLSKHLSALHCPAKLGSSALQRPPLIRWPSSRGSSGAHALYPLWSEETQRKRIQNEDSQERCHTFDCDARHCHVQLHSHRDRHTKHVHTCSHSSYGCKNTKKKLFIFKVCFFLCAKQVQKDF